MEEIVCLGTWFWLLCKASKSWLVVKENYYDAACRLFAGTSLKITTEGRPYLGTPLGSPEFTTAFVKSNVCLWRDDVLKLSNFASSQPHAAYSAMIHGLYPLGLS